MSNPFWEEWEWGLWRGQQRSRANVGPTLLQVLCHLLHSNTWKSVLMLPGRGNKKKACIQFAVWHCQPRGPHWLFVPSCFWHQEHASALCLSLLCTVLVPDPHLTSRSIANTHWTFIGALDTSWFLPLPTLCFHNCPCMTAAGCSGGAEISFPPPLLALLP